MSANVGRNTGPELAVRRILHVMGYRYRIHGATLPGRPDIVFSRRRKVIEVRGCFWHRHPGCPAAATPATRPEFWADKFATTVARDARNLAALETAGWRVLVIWECELGDPRLSGRLLSFLGPPRHAAVKDLAGDS